MITAIILKRSKKSIIFAIAWQPDIAEWVRQYVEEIIEVADQDALDILRSRVVEQEVLDLLDEPGH